MIDRSRAGARCIARLDIPSPMEGESGVPKGSHGSIRYEMDNLKRDLVLVDWDNGIEVLVFPHEIEVMEEAERKLGNAHEE